MPPTRLYTAGRVQAETNARPGLPAAPIRSICRRLPPTRLNAAGRVRVETNARPGLPAAPVKLVPTVPRRTESTVTLPLTTLDATGACRPTQHTHTHAPVRGLLTVAVDVIVPMTALGAQLFFRRSQASFNRQGSFQNI